MNKNLIDLEIKTYDCQIGMYFSNIQHLKNGFVVYSNIVEDFEWNFFTGFTAKTITEFKNAYNEAKQFLESKNRKPCFIISPSVTISKEVQDYINYNSKELTKNVTMLASSINLIKKPTQSFLFKRIDNITEKDIFIDTFTKSKTQTLPNDTYNALPNFYFQALKESFNNNTNWNFLHYISMKDKTPIGMVSACVKDEYCGLYGAGTFIKYRKNGVFNNLLKYIENELSTLGVKHYFCITKKDSYNEALYNKFGFNSVFSSTYYQ